MKHLFRHIITVITIVIITITGCGINIYSYCCDDCASRGKWVLLSEGGCNEVHKHHHCDYQHAETNNNHQHSKADSNDNSTRCNHQHGNQCSVKHIAMSDYISIHHEVNYQPIVLSLLDFETISYNIDIVQTALQHQSFVPHSPPSSGREILTNISTLRI